MKIEHEVTGVRVVRKNTIAETLTSYLNGRFSGAHPYLFLSKLFSRKSLEERLDLSSVLYGPLWKEYEGERAYERTFALVSLDMETDIREFYREVCEAGYYPASISEGLSFALVLSARSIDVDPMFHLGTVLFSREYVEQRLLTKKNGECEIVALYPTTKLKPHYKIAVLKKTREQRFEK